ncbi:hypothetical protein F5Y12DRAFT_770542 [Xylaria sp. FL1777]|nr:hypothetical protein F5Y12DRAFT_770542 [Xylaria sp. FL1777]
MSTSVIEKVNLGIKHTLEAASSILTPPAREQSQSPGPAAGKKTRGSTGLAPVSAAPPPSDFYMPGTSSLSIEQLTEDEGRGSNKKKDRERKKSERKARREEKRKVKREKSKEKKENRKQAKERNRKEKEWEKVAKKGGELPAHLLQGLRITSSSKVPYNPNCDICTKSAASITSSKKRDPKCTTCAKAAEREFTNQYLKSSNINLGDISSTEELLDAIRNVLEIISKELKLKGDAQAGDKGRANEELVQHISLHVRDLATHGGPANLRGHKCNAECQPGRHGLDGNRDSPVSTDRGQIISHSSRNSDTPTRPATPPEVDWWVQAMSKESPTSPNRPLSPCAVTPLPRSSTTVYEPRSLRYSVPNLFDVSHAAYHFYLPFPICHGYYSSPGRFAYSHNYSTPIFPRPVPIFSQEQPFNQELPFPTFGLAETLPSNTPQASQDGAKHLRSRSGSI